MAWFVSGCIKYSINYMKYGNDAKKRVGNGGFPSTHTTVMTTTTVIVGLNEGYDSSLFALGVAVTFIVIIDAMGIRSALGKHSAIINQMAEKESGVHHNLRESQGHTRSEILGGLFLGSLLAFILKPILSYL